MVDESALVDLVPSDDDGVPDLVPSPLVPDLGASFSTRAPITNPLVPPSAAIPPSPPHVSHNSPEFTQSLVQPGDMEDEDEDVSLVDNAPPAAASVTPSVSSRGPIATPTPSFPNSPPPRLRPLTSNPSPSHTYTDQQYVPADRDFALDYEAVMGTIQDLHSMSTFMLRGGVRRVFSGGRYRQYTREDVIPILRELKDMLDRLFSRLNG